jgi:hypothetical protein
MYTEKLLERRKTSTVTSGISSRCPVQLASLATNTLLLTTKKKRKKMTMIMKTATITPIEISFSPYGSLPEGTHTESNPGH